VSVRSGGSWLSLSVSSLPEQVSLALLTGAGSILCIAPPPPGSVTVTVLASAFTCRGKCHNSTVNVEASCPVACFNGVSSS